MTSSMVASGKRAPLVCTRGISVLAMLSVRAAAAAPPAPELYDCHAEYDIWQQAWTPDWKTWCCEHHHRGCPTSLTSTSTVSSTITVTSTTRTVSVTSTTGTTTTRTSETSTSSSGTQTTRTQSVTSSVTSSSTTKTVTTSTLDPCLQNCTVDGMEATCASRIQWSSEHMTSMEKEPCEAARVLVVSQCTEQCYSCPVADSGCDVQQSAAFRFRKKFEEPASEATASLRGRSIGASLLPINTAIGALVAFVSSALLAVVLRRKNPDSVYQNLLTHEDLEYDEDDEAYSMSSLSEMDE